MNKAIASMLGGAIGDALGVTQEIFPKSSQLKEIIAQVKEQRNSRATLQTNYEGGGPWTHSGLILSPGEWTDDTSMMLCLADSILRTHTIDNANLMQHFYAWWFEGYNSCRGSSLGLGRNTKKALYSFDPEHPDIVTGGTDPENDAGNGAIMRLAPVPIFWRGSLDQAQEMARKQAASTHNIPETRDASALMTYVIWHGLNGWSKEDIFESLHECSVDHEGIKELTLPNAAWRTKDVDDIITLPGRCMWSLEAALWCLHKTNNFRDAIVLAINLGGDADTVGAITGQMAGAIYGLEQIPDEWLTQLHHRNAIEERAKALFHRSPMNENMKLKYQK